MAPDTDRIGESFRTLTNDEVSLMTERGCHCDDWSRVRVAQHFDARTVKTTHFSGDVTLGVFEKQVSFFGGFVKLSSVLIRRKCGVCYIKLGICLRLLGHESS